MTRPIRLHVIDPPGVALEVADPAPVELSISGTMPYTGPLNVTPNQSEQVLQTAGRAMPGNVVVNPIPSNYGLITYNGAIITVS